jgi:hypothetical protein
VCQAGDSNNSESFMEWVLVCNPNMTAEPDGAVLSPQAKRKAGDSERVCDTELVAVFSKTEIMLLNFHQSCKLSQGRGQALMSTETSRLQSSNQKICRARPSYI